MRVESGQLHGHLKQTLAPVYLISGDEPLLVDECSAAIHARANDAGFERTVHQVEAGFDWGRFAVDVASPSLFSPNRLHELRLPTGKPGDSGAKTLLELVARPHAQTVLLVISGKLDKSAQQTKWVQALEQAGVWVQVWPIDAARFPEWIRARLQSRGVKAAAGVAEQLAYHMEGNALAAAQEVDKLALLFGDQVVNPKDVEAGLSDNSRFTVYGWVDACLAGEPDVMQRKLERLRTDGTEPILLLWAFTRELRSLLPMARALKQGKGEAAVLQAHHVWAQRRPMVSKALKRLSVDRLLQLLARAAHADRVLKGRAQGDVWHELERLSLAGAGVRIPAGVANE